MTALPAPLRRVRLVDPTIGAEELAAVTDVLAGGQLTVGEVNRQFEAELAQALGAPAAVAVSSGTAALHLALLALGLTPGDEVVVPSLSFVASAAVTALHGGVPVFADVVSARRLSISPDDVARLITGRTRAVVVMHYGGDPAAVEDVVTIARAHGVPVVEDAAHAPVVRSAAGRMLGTIGDVGCFSFHATKNLTTGEGGLVVARDPAVLDRVRALRGHCLTTSFEGRQWAAGTGYEVSGAGLNYRLTELAAAVGRVQLRRLPDDRRRRRALTGRYRQLLAALPEVGLPESALLEAGQAGAVDRDAAHHLMTVLLPAAADRARVQERLARAGVQTSVHYPPTHLFRHYRTAPDRADVRTRERLPVTESVASRLLTLPLHSRMDDQDVEHVVHHLAAALGRGATAS